MKNKNLTAVVTGANRGIGLSFCENLKNQGYKIYGVCRKSSDKLQEVADVIIDDIDIGDESDCEKLFAKLANVQIDLLINNAGILFNETLHDLNFDSIEKQFQINTLGALRVTSGLINNLSAESKIALITSRMGSIADNGSGGYYGYRMSKAALNAAGKSLAIDLKPKGILVGIFHPGYVATDMVGGNGDILPDEAATKILRLVDKLNANNSGDFWHSNGENLPW